jgi:hypothetical protein
VLRAQVPSCIARTRASALCRYVTCRDACAPSPRRAAVEGGRLCSQVAGTLGGSREVDAHPTHLREVATILSDPILAQWSSLSSPVARSEAAAQTAPGPKGGSGSDSSWPLSSGSALARYSSPLPPPGIVTQAPCADRLSASLSCQCTSPASAASRSLASEARGRRGENGGGDAGSGTCSTTPLGSVSTCSRSVSPKMRLDAAHRSRERSSSYRDATDTPYRDATDRSIQSSAATSPLSVGGRQGRMRLDGAGAESGDALSGSRPATSRGGTGSPTSCPRLSAAFPLSSPPVTRPTGEGNTGEGHDGQDAQDARGDTQDSSAERAVGGAEDKRRRRMRVWSASMRAWSATRTTTQHIHLIPQPDLTPTRAGADVFAADVFSSLSGARTTEKRKEARKEPGAAAKTARRGGTEIPAGRGSSGGRGETESPNTSGTASTECEHRAGHPFARIMEEGRKSKQAACAERARRRIWSADKTPEISSSAKTNVMASPAKTRTISSPAITKHMPASAQEKIQGMPSSGSWSWGQSGSMSASTRVRSKVRSKGSAEQAPISKGWAQQAAALSTESTHTHTQSTSASQRHHHVRPCSHADSDWSSEDGRGSADAFLADSNAVNSWHPSHVTSWSHVPCALTRQAWSQSSAGPLHPRVP